LANRYQHRKLATWKESKDEISGNQLSRCTDIALLGHGACRQRDNRGVHPKIRLTRISKRFASGPKRLPKHSASRSFNTFRPSLTAFPDTEPGRGRHHQKAKRDHLHSGRLQGDGSCGRKINAAGIPVINITDRSAGGNFVAYVGADDYSIGFTTARTLLKAIGGTGNVNVIILEGVKGSLTNTDRVRGFNDAIKENPNVKLLASQPANYQRLQALQVMENLTQSFPSIDGVLAANDAMAVGAIEALDSADRKALVVGISGSKEAIELIKSGKLLASADFNGFIQG
jgi:hypothetical protein